MSFNINRAIISGNLTRDPESRALPSGSTVLTFGVAVNDSRKNPSTGQWEDVPNYINCVAFGSRAESLAKILTKGTKVCVEGKLRWSQWGEGDQKRSKIEVIVDNLDLLSAPRSFDGESNYQRPSMASAPAENQIPSASVPIDVYDDEDIPF